MNEQQVNLKDIEGLFDKNWNEIVNILSEVIGTDVALINRINGSELEVLKKKEKNKELFAENKTYDLATVYCNDVVKNKKLLEINNAVEDEHWENYKGLEYGLLSYLGYPILNPNDEVVGTICVEDRNEKYFTDTEKNLLLQFKQVIENQLKQFEITRKLEENIEEGKELHKQYLPSEMPEIEQLSFATYYQAANQIGGDFYDLVKIKNKLLFYISDVSGHNLSSSILNIFLKEAINSYLLFNQENDNSLSPANILNYIRDRFQKETFPPEYFISIIIGVIDLENFKIKISNAGFHIPPLVTTKAGNTSSLLCKGLPISNLGENFDYEDSSFELGVGDTLYLNTDGLIDQTNSRGELYGKIRLTKLISKSAHLKPEETLSKIYDDFLKFKKNMPVQDDLTSLLIQRKK